MTNEKAANIAKAILNKLGVSPDSELYMLYLNKLIGYCRDELLKSVKHELKSIEGDPVGGEFYNAMIEHHKVNQVLVITINKKDGKRIVGHTSFGTTPEHAREAKALGDGIASTIVDIPK